MFIVKSYLIAGGGLMGFMNDMKESVKYANAPQQAAKKICPECGHMGNEVRFTKGSFGIELLLWLCGIVPGLIYSVWRLSTKRNGCSQCKGNMIPTTSPRGKALLEQYHQ